MLDKIYWMWLKLLSPVVAHLIRRRVVLVWRRRPVLGSYPYRGNLKREFVESYAWFARPRPLSVMLDESDKFDGFEFYLESPQPMEWRRDDRGPDA